MTYTIEGTTGPWELVIGLEVHAQVISHSKLFSGAATTFGSEPNTQVSFIDAGFPGMLPVINRECVAQAVRTGLGLNAHINLMSRFDRKNYFYADLPQGYQISQYEHPIVGAGTIEIELESGETRSIGITRLHLEQDAGKSMHDQHASKSLIDLNRSGVALMEIVSEPDMRTPEEAGAYLRKLRTILRYLGTCDGNMDEGSMRADVNVSVRKHGEPFRTRCEIKNVNSIRFVMLAVEAEARRQIDLWESGGTVDQETRLFDPARGETRSMRSKEDAHDYRYFPEPDLLPLVLDEAWVESLKGHLPELPDEKRARLMQEFGLSRYEAAIFVMEQTTADFFETVASGRDPKQVANWMLGDFFAALNRTGTSIETSPVSAANLGALLDLITDGTINGKIAKDVLEIMVETGEAPAAIVESRGLRQVTDTGAIDAAIETVLAANADKLAQYQSGKDKLFGFFVGQVMKAMQGKGNPALVNEALKRRIGAPTSPISHVMIRLLLALAVLALPFAAHAKSPPDKSPVVQVAGMVPPIAFTMKDATTGHTVTAASFRGKVVLLYFGYTNCPDVCPDTLYKMHKLYQRLGADADKIVFLFVTVDPKRDTLPILKKYVALFDPHYIALRGTPNQIYRLTRRYRVVASVHPSPNPEQYRVVHSALIYAFGTHGNARFIIPGIGLNPHPNYQALAHDLKQLTHPQPRGILTWLAQFG